MRLSDDCVRRFFRNPLKRFAEKRAAIQVITALWSVDVLREKVKKSQHKQKGEAHPDITRDRFIEANLRCRRIGFH